MVASKGKKLMVINNKLSKNYDANLFAAVSNSGVSLVKLLGYVNGTSVVAVLAFIGHLATSKYPKIQINVLTLPLGLFLSGLILTLVTGAFVFFATKYSAKMLYKAEEANRLTGKEAEVLENSSDNAKKKSTVFYWLAVGVGIISLAFFIAGCAYLYLGFTSLD